MNPNHTDGVFQDVFRAVKKPQRWVIDDLIPTGLTLIGGEPKSNKSLLALICSALVTGMKCKALPPFMSRVMDHGDVQLYSAEAEAGVIRDIMETNLQVQGIADGRLLVADDPFQFQLDNERGVKELLFWLKERNPKLAAIDPFADFHSLEEKDAQEMIRILRPLRQWAVENHNSLILVHHARKAQEGGRPQGGSKQTLRPSDLRGSSAIFGKADAVLMCTRLEDNSLNIHATFKRAKEWERRVFLRAFGRWAPAREHLSELSLRVLKMLEAGAKNSFQISGRIQGVDRKRIVECLNQLERNEIVKFNKEAKRWDVKLKMGQL